MLCVAMFAFFTMVGSVAMAQEDSGRWSAQQANEWYAKQPWLVGCNYIPRTAINQLEMWQADTFDPKTIEQELGWAQHTGFNTLRVFLHDKAYEADPEGFKKRIDTFLTICASHHIRPLFVFFDDCWNPDPKIGRQPEPRKSVHNSGWMQSPGRAMVNDPGTWGPLEKYVTDILTTFGKDDRILMWDLYNEPGNSGEEGKSLPLLKGVFEWARAAKPTQPISAGQWNKAPAFDGLNQFQLSHSDVITFHVYAPPAESQKWITELKKLGRPVICTEYMARTRGSTFKALLPVFKRNDVGAINWGFVSGKTNTIFAWDTPEGSPTPKVWFHDIYRADGTPFDATEVTFIRQITGRK
jgi:hypothetical protein